MHYEFKQKQMEASRKRIEWFIAAMLLAAVALGAYLCRNRPPNVTDQPGVVSEAPSFVDIPADDYSHTRCPAAFPHPRGYLVKSEGNANHLIMRCDRGEE